MSALSKAARRESNAYQAMVDAQADVIAHQLAGIDNADTARLRKKSQAARREWQTASRLYEAASVAWWEDEPRRTRHHRAVLA